MTSLGPRLRLLSLTLPLALLAASCQDTQPTNVSDAGIDGTLQSPDAQSPDAQTQDAPSADATNQDALLVDAAFGADAPSSCTTGQAGWEQDFQSGSRLRAVYLATEE